MTLCYMIYLHFICLLTIKKPAWTSRHTGNHRPLSWPVPLHIPLSSQSRHSGSHCQSTLPKIPCLSLVLSCTGGLRFCLRPGCYRSLIFHLVFPHCLSPLHLSNLTACIFLLTLACILFSSYERVAFCDMSSFSFPSLYPFPFLFPLLETIDRICSHFLLL